jgi:hypothetical protein
MSANSHTGPAARRATGVGKSSLCANWVFRRPRPVWRHRPRPRNRVHWKHPEPCGTACGAPESVLPTTFTGSVGDRGRMTDGAVPLTLREQSSTVDTTGTIVDSDTLAMLTNTGCTESHTAAAPGGWCKNGTKNSGDENRRPTRPPPGRARSAVGGSQIYPLDYYYPVLTADLALGGNEREA